MNKLGLPAWAVAPNAVPEPKRYAPPGKVWLVSRDPVWAAMLRRYLRPDLPLQDLEKSSAVAGRTSPRLTRLCCLRLAGGKSRYISPVATTPCRGFAARRDRSRGTRAYRDTGNDAPRGRRLARGAKPARG